MTVITANLSLHLLIQMHLTCFHSQMPQMQDQSASRSSGRTHTEVSDAPTVPSEEHGTMQPTPAISSVPEAQQEHVPAPGILSKSAVVAPTEFYTGANGTKILVCALNCM